MLNIAETEKTTSDFQVKRDHWADDSIYFGAEVFISKVFEKEKLKGRIIGLSEYNFLILEMPLVIGYRAKFSPGSTVVVKFVREGSVYGFYSEVLQTQYDPAPIMYAKYPKEVESFDFRSSKRFACNLPARLFNNQGHYYGMINDISNGGCHLTVHRSCAREHITADENVTLLMSLYGLGDLELDCYIKNVAFKGDNLTYGIEFRQNENSPKLQKYLDMLDGRFE